MGAKALYYNLVNDEIIISSSFQFIDDLKRNSRNKDNSFLYDLFGFAPFGYTLNPDIYYVEPGTLLCIKHGLKPKIQKSYQINSEIIVNNFDWEKLLKKRLKQNIPSVPVALAFSGGVDSSVLAKLSYDMNYKIPLYNLQIEHNIIESKNAVKISKKLNANLVKCLINYEKISNKKETEIFDHPVKNRGITSTALLALVNK